MEPSLREQPVTVMAAAMPSLSNVRMLTQEDVIASRTRPPRRLSPITPQQTTNHIPQYPTTVDIPMQEIRRQNDVDRWRNKLRLQEKFEVISTI